MVLTESGEECLTVACCGGSWVENFPVNNMSSNGSAAQIYNSTFRHGVDEKRRIQIPSMWRPEEPNTQLTLMVWRQRSEGACLRVLPPKEMTELLAELDAMPSGDPRKTVLKRIIGSESAQVVLDKAGRICVPEAMARAAGIENEVVLVGLLDRFEIWNPERHEKVNMADAIMVQEALKLME
jgi:MraZ protein